MRIIVFIFFLFSCIMFEVQGQSPPSIDGNWELNGGLSDEFNSTSLDQGKWDASNCLTGHCWGDGAMDGSHVTVDGSNLKLKVDYKDGILTSAAIKSDLFNYGYGYYEIEAKLPGFNNNGQSCGEGFWPCFWTYYTDIKNPSVFCGTKNPYYTHREIDILEPSGAQYANAKTNVHGWWTNQKTGYGNCPIKYGEHYFNSSTPLYEGYHKYAVEWFPNRLIFYFDDVPYYSVYNDESVPDNNQRVVISQQLGGGGSTINPSTPLPQYMTINYFRFYKIINTYCGEDVSIQNNAQLSSFVFGVRRNITIGNGSNYITLSSGDKKTFRATNAIAIYGDFTVPLGSELNLIPTPCN